MADNELTAERRAQMRYRVSIEAPYRHIYAEDVPVLLDYVESLERRKQVTSFMWLQIIINTCLWTVVIILGVKCLKN